MKSVNKLILLLFILITSLQLVQGQISNSDIKYFGESVNYRANIYGGTRALIASYIRYLHPEHTYMEVERDIQTIGRNPKLFDEITYQIVLSQEGDKEKSAYLINALCDDADLSIRIVSYIKIKYKAKLINAIIINKNKQKKEEQEKLNKIIIKNKEYNLETYDTSKYNKFVENFKRKFFIILKYNSSFPNWNELENKTQKYFTFRNTYTAYYKLVNNDIESTEDSTDTESFDCEKEFKLISGNDSSCTLINQIHPFLNPIYYKGIKVKTSVKLNKVDVDFIKGITNVKIKDGIVTYQINIPPVEIGNILNDKLKKEVDGFYKINYKIGKIMGETFVDYEKKIDESLDPIYIAEKDSLEKIKDSINRKIIVEKQAQEIAKEKYNKENSEAIPENGFSFDKLILDYINTNFPTINIGTLKGEFIIKTNGDVENIELNNNESPNSSKSVKHIGKQSIMNFIKSIKWIPAKKNNIPKESKKHFTITFSNGQEPIIY